MSGERLRVTGGGALNGRVVAPGDKSLTHRAFLFAAMANGRSVVRGANAGDDCARMLGALRALGVETRHVLDTASADEDPAIAIEGRGTESWRSPAAALDLGNSGTAMRLLAGALAPLVQIEATLTGDDSLRSRPMARVIEPLRKMGAQIDGADEGRRAPLALRGARLRGIRHVSPVPSAQVKSAVLLAGLGAEGVTSVLEPVASRDHTERLLKAMGAQLAFCDGNARLTPGRPLAPIDWDVPRDPSGAAFFLAAACVLPGSEVIAEGVSINPTRIGFAGVLRRMGASIEVIERSESYREPVGDIVSRCAAEATATGGGPVTHGVLRGTIVEAREIPSLIDEVPMLAAVAALAEGETRFENVGELRVKESDRLAGIVAGLHAMGAHAAIEEGAAGIALLVRGGARGRLRGAPVTSANDHRIAMAFALLAIAAAGDTVIDGAEMIETSYPDFERTLSSLRE
jgi:3-phosphoshikimate 1-carboxyvinyltransferase